MPPSLGPPVVSATGLQQGVHIVAHRQVLGRAIALGDRTVGAQPRSRAAAGGDHVADLMRLALEPAASALPPWPAGAAPVCWITWVSSCATMRCPAADDGSTDCDR